MNRNLTLHLPVLDGTQDPLMIANVTHDAKRYRRSTRRDGGYWTGSFTLVDNVFKLANMFYEYLGCHFVEKSSGYTTWEGLVYEMDLNIGGVSRRRTLDLMFNYVYTVYTDTTDEIQNSEVTSNTASINRYGQREEILYLDGYPQGAAEAYRDTYLKEYAWPWPRVVGLQTFRDEDASLEFTLAGYIFTANWRFSTTGDGSEGNVSDYISEIVSAHCPSLKIGAINTNTVQVRKISNISVRAYDQIQELTDIGDGSANPWRFYVENDRRAHYRQVDNTPQYYLKHGKLVSAIGTDVAINPWVVKPGVVRDMDFPAGKKNLGSWLEDARDFYVSEVEFGDDMEKPLLKTDHFEESEMLAAQEEFRREQEEQ